MRILRAGSTSTSHSRCSRLSSRRRKISISAPVFLLVAVETCRKDFRVVEHEEVLFFEIVENVLEDAVFDRAFLAVDDHQSRIVPIAGRMFRYHFGCEFVPVLR